MTRRLFFDSTRCSGCLSCVTYCSLRTNGAVSTTSAGIRLLHDVFDGRNTAYYCRQCANAPCAEQCPASAIHLCAEGGFWFVDHAECVGCRTCVEACTFGAIVWDARRNRVVKCETCEGAPLCVQVCPTGALRWIEAGNGLRSPEDMTDCAEKTRDG